MNIAIHCFRFIYGLRHGIEEQQKREMVLKKWKTYSAMRTM